jgi:hypothetical protein
MARESNKKKMEIDKEMGKLKWVRRACELTGSSDGQVQFGPVQAKKI